jgi:signal transduction histidine kinase
MLARDACDNFAGAETRRIPRGRTIRPAAREAFARPGGCSRVPLRTLAGFAAAVGAILIAVTAYVFVVADRDRKAAHVTDRSESVLSLQRLEDALARAESGQRGYLLTREDGYLDAYRRAVADVHAELDTVGRRDPHVRADALVALVEAKLAELRRGVEVRDADGLAKAQRELRSGNGAWLSETIEAVRAEMESRERTELREHRRAWFERVAVADAIFLAANAVLLALVTGAGLAARAEMRRRAEQAQERLRMLELQERVLGIVSHDLRSPLAAIQGGAVILSRTRLAPEHARVASIVLASSRRMERIIRDLLDYTRTRARTGIPLSLRATDAGDVCARVADEAALSGRGVVELHREGDLSGEWDPDRLEQAIANLVANGIEHAPPGTAVRLRAAGEADRVGIRVENDGPPIPPDAVRSLFDPFQRHATAGGRPGLGLGLFIVRTIVEAHGGTVEVDSAASPVAFVVRLPRARPGARRDAPPPDVWRSTRPAGRHAGASVA